MIRDVCIVNSPVCASTWVSHCRVKDEEGWRKRVLERDGNALDATRVRVAGRVGHNYVSQLNDLRCAA